MGRIPAEAVVNRPALAWLLAARPRWVVPVPENAGIRPAVEADRARIVELALLDGLAAPLAGANLVAEVGGVVVAAVEVATGRVVADPFQPTVAVAAELVKRAARERASLGSTRPGWLQRWSPAQP